MARTQADRDEGLALGRLLERKDAEIERLRAALLSSKQSHYQCDDSWYSCPKSEDGCSREGATGCNCGADKHNAMIDAALGITPSNDDGTQPARSQVSA